MKQETLPAAIRVEIPSLAMDEGELVKVLESSLYPGADLASIKLMVGVCRAARLDPLQKPYHLVPMDVKVKKPGGGSEYVKRDVVMPGIGLYRIQAERTGEYAGCSEPTFGPTQKLTWTEERQETQESAPADVKVEFEYPEWCRMCVRRMVNGQIVEFWHTEYWIENYATNAKGSKVPNAMWKKRPRGQLVKCTEAQCLRKAFPSIGAVPTAEEMEGKTLDLDGAGNLIDGRNGKVIEPVPPLMAKEPVSASAPAASNGAQSAQETDAGAGGAGAGDDKPLTDGERAHIKAKLAAANLTEVDLKAKYGADIAGLKASQFKPVKAWIAETKPA
jgi:phage recombination protein Bet